MVNAPPILFVHRDARGAGARVAETLGVQGPQRVDLPGPEDSAALEAVTETIRRLAAAGARAAIVLAPVEEADLIAAAAAAQGLTRRGYIDPTARIAPTASLAATAVVMENAKIQHRARLDEGAFVDALAVVGFGATLGAASWVGPSAAIGAEARIGPGARIAARATVAPGLQLGPSAVVGPSSAALADMAAQERLQGPRSRPLPTDADATETSLAISRFRPLGGDQEPSEKEKRQLMKRYHGP